MRSDFRPIELGDRSVFMEFFALDSPLVSEMTFTNLFMWRHKYFPRWTVSDGCLMIVLEPPGEDPFAFPPVGGGDKAGCLHVLMEVLSQKTERPMICRADKRFVDRYVDPVRFEALEDRANFDYVYLTKNLVELSGKDFYKKRNRLNKFIKNNEFEYRPLAGDLVDLILDLQEEWCRVRECEIDPGLFQENIAIHEAMAHFHELGLKGGAILMDSKVEAFALGEMLNPDTAVIHVEKANPRIPGLYAAINQFFCKEAWAGVEYVNREQDLGVEGLRMAKLSYRPDHLVEKYTIVPK